MIELKPQPYSDFICPECHSSSVYLNEILFPGLHISADCFCNNCGLKFINDFPSGQSLYYPAVLGKENNKNYSRINHKWFHDAFWNSYKNQNNSVLNIEKKVFKEEKEIIILNCIDYLYGHVLLKLFNAHSYLRQYPEKGLVIILPKSFAWLLPEKISEAWLVDIKLSEGREWFNSFNSFVKEELNRFEKVFLSIANPHPDFSDFDISFYTGTKKFNLEKFYKKPFRVSFIYRNDRFWFSSKREEYLFDFLKKIGLSDFARKIFSSRLNKKINKLFNFIKIKIPDVEFYVIGLGKYGKLNSEINDKREEKLTSEKEKEWCRLYSESHIVIGIHGSNMILPTALSAGFIEILPESRYSNIIQDIAAYYEGPLYLFLCRFVTEFIKPKTVANIAYSIFKDFNHFYSRYNSKLIRHNIYRNLEEFPDLI